MIEQIKTERLEDAIDRFEETWSSGTRSSLHELLSQYGLHDDVEAITELARIDVELRHRHSQPINLDSYLSDFPCLRDANEWIGRIAFEDFRALQDQGQAVTPERWQHLPGIRNELWFQRLLVDGQHHRFASHPAPRHLALNASSDAGINVAFQSALAEQGFRLVEEIGEGAMGRVYLATQNELADRHVVLKVVSQPMSEPQNMALLQHTNIVPIYSFFQVLSRSVICMPYAGRLTLADFLDHTSDPLDRVGQSLITTVRGTIDATKTAVASSQFPLSESGQSTHNAPDLAALTPAADEQAVSKPLEELRKLDRDQLATWLFRRLASALAHAHARGVLHNDLKPGNVLIRNDGEPALLDFNLSQSLGTADLTRAGGTLPYMSPETYRALMGRKRATQESSDIYSMGVMLFQFATGRLPYPAPKTVAAMDLEPAIESRKSSPPWSAEDKVQPGLKSIINHCLAYEPEQRYQSADHLHTDLQLEHQSLPLAYATEPKRTRVRKWFRRHPAATSAGSVAAILLACLIPLGFASAAWVKQTRQIRANEAFQAFSKDSERTLAMMLSDNRRSEDGFVNKAMATLKEHGVLDESKFKAITSAAMPESQRRKVLETAMRHVVLTGIWESERLTKKATEQDLQLADQQRLQQLIVAADRLLADHLGAEKKSRAIEFLKASAAKHALQEDLSNKLRVQASAMQPHTDAELYLEAIRLMSASNHPRAAEILSQLADRNAIPPGLRWIAIGRAQFSNEDHKEASLSYTQAIDHCPDLLALLCLRGSNFMAIGEGERAMSDFTRAIELEPEQVRGWMHRGSLRLGRREFDDAISDFSQALTIAPGHIEALLMRARAFRSTDRHEQAERDVQAAMESKDISEASLRTRAIARKKTDPEGALNDLQLADKMSPNNPLVLSMIGRLLSDQFDRDEEAVDYLRRVNEIQPNDERTLVDYAVLLARADRHVEAREKVDRAMVSPNNKRSYFQAACACALNPATQSRIDALKFLSKALHEGYVARNLDSDPDLQLIRKMPAFNAILRVNQLANSSTNRSP